MTLSNKDILGKIDSIKPDIDTYRPFPTHIAGQLREGYCPVITHPVRRADYISSLQRSDKGDLLPIREFILSVIHVEMKSLKRLIKGLVGQ